MPTPVSEQIAVVIKSRLDSISTGSGYETTTTGAIRPTKQGGFQPKDYQTVIRTRRNPVVKTYPGNPPRVERRLEIEIRANVRPSDSNDAAIDTLVDTFAADVTKSITSVTDWRTFGGLAVNAMADVDSDFETSEDGSSGWLVSVLHVFYRHPEDDPYTVAA